MAKIKQGEPIDVLVIGKVDPKLRRALMEKSISVMRATGKPSSMSAAAREILEAWLEKEGAALLKGA